MSNALQGWRVKDGDLVCGFLSSFLMHDSVRLANVYYKHGRDMDPPHFVFFLSF